ncbi:MAG: inositol monophosphatase [Actinomycetota bacterium]|nr:inositol monophosphatase [Actinomycetota bacterium]
MNATDVADVLDQVATAVAAALEGLEDWGLAHTREGQYRHDLVADAAALAVLNGAGFGTVSEESGVHHPERSITVVLDPVDGSTNASHGLPWWATSACAIDGDGPLAAVVVNQATGNRYRATRGGGATRDGEPIGPTACEEMSKAIVAFSGYPTRHVGWGQYRSLGAAALDLCAVASGSLDAFMDCAPTSLAPWDYLGALLVCNEAGASMTEASGQDLVVTEFGPRRAPVAAATPELLAQVLAARQSL